MLCVHLFAETDALLETGPQGDASILVKSKGPNCSWKPG
jgi:hypothetical protein